MPEHAAPRARFDVLDALRGIAAIAVAWYHLQGLLHFHGYPPAPSGYLAVDFFFCLSGFVIAHTYDERFATGLRWPRFLSMRLIRFYPFYLFGTLLGVAVWVLHVPLPGGPAEYTASSLLSAAYLSVFFIPVWSATISPPQFYYPFNFAAWTLFFELAVNVLYAALFPRMTRRVLIAAICVCAGLLIATAFHDRTLDAGFAYAALPGVARTGFSFFTGVLLRRCWKRSMRRPCGLMPLALLLIAAVTLPLHGLWELCFDLCVILFVFPALVYAGASLANERSTGIGAMRRLGEASYGFYAIHMPALVLLTAFIAPRFVHGLADLALFAYGSAIIAVVLLLTAAFDRYVDRPLRRSIGSRLQPLPRSA